MLRLKKIGAGNKRLPSGPSNSGRAAKYLCNKIPVSREHLHCLLELITHGAIRVQQILRHAARRETLVRRVASIHQAVQRASLKDVLQRQRALCLAKGAQRAHLRTTLHAEIGQ